MKEIKLSKEIQTDQLSNVDELGRDKIASEISENILYHIDSSNESLVIGIHGPWGSGKSNLLHFVKNKIKNSSKYTKTLEVDGIKVGVLNKMFPKSKSNNKKLYILEFNPWIFSGKEQLHYAFLNEFALKVQSKSHQIRSKIESFAKKIRWIEELNGVGAAAHRGISAFSEIPVEKLKEETNQILKDENIHVIIIIDDIDRLAPSEMLEVFQLVKLNANFANTLFLVSFDKTIVSQSIYNSYHIHGDEYLEKIIQVDYSIPSIPLEDLESMFFKRLKKVIGDDTPFDISLLHAPWLMHGLRFYFKNIRDLNRYFNSVSFRLPAIHEHVNLHDFFLIEAIRLFDFNSYEIIRDNYKEAINFGDRSYFNNELSRISSGSTKQIYHYLFGPSKNQNPLGIGDLRIHDTEFFDRYFTMTISKRDVREDEFNRFIHYPAARLDLLNSLIRNKKSEFLLRRLVAKTDDFKNLDLLSAMSPLLSVWGDFREEFVEQWRNVWSAIKAIIKSSPDANIGYNKLLDEISVTTSDFSPARSTFSWLIIQNISQDDVRNIDPDIKPQYELFYANRERLEKSFKLFLENNSNFFFSYPSLYHDFYQRIFLLSLAKMLPDKYEQNITQLIDDDQRTVIFLDKLIFKDHETRQPVDIDYQTIAALVPNKLKDKFVLKIFSLNPEAFSKEKAGLISFFKQNFKN